MKKLFLIIVILKILIVLTVEFSSQFNSRLRFSMEKELLNQYKTFNEKLEKMKDQSNEENKKTFEKEELELDTRYNDLINFIGTKDKNQTKPSQ